MLRVRQEVKLSSIQGLKLREYKTYLYLHTNRLIWISNMQIGKTSHGVPLLIHRQGQI